MARVTHYIFGDEAGDLTSKPVFVLGMVKASEPEMAEQVLEGICELNGHLGEVKSESTYRPVHRIRIGFIDYFASEPTLEFRCLITRPATFNIGYYSRNHLGIHRQDMAYNHLYRMLLDSNLGSTERAIAYLDNKSRHRNDNLFEYLRNQVRPLADAQPKDSKSSRLLQLADVLAGCVYNENSGATHPLKTATRDYALNRLGVRTLTRKVSGNKFNVWHFAPRNARRSPDPRRE